MNNLFRRAAAKGFTLIELLIVVIIIAILAAIAIPQFGNTANDAQEAALDANLSTVRSAIELYRAQHNNRFPATVATAGGANCDAANQGTGTIANEAGRAQSLTDSLTMFSTAAGQTCRVNPAGGPYIFGPYLRAFPTEPVTQNAAIAIIDNVANPVPAAGATGGWRYNTANGQFIMNSNALARDQRPFSQH